MCASVHLCVHLCACVYVCVCESVCDTHVRHCVHDEGCESIRPSYQTGPDQFEEDLATCHIGQ